MAIRWAKSLFPLEHSSKSLNIKQLPSRRRLRKRPTEIQQGKKTAQKNVGWALAIGYVHHALLAGRPRCLQQCLANLANLVIMRRG